MIQDPLPIGKALLNISVNEAMIKNLSLTPENITEFTAKAVLASEKSLNSLATVDLDCLE